MSEAKEASVTVTAEDVEFVKRARGHYKIFAEQSEKQGQPAEVVGLFRKQEFYAERFLTRLSIAGTE